MPTVFTHAVVGYAAAHAGTHRGRVHARVLLTAATLPVLPDLDVFLRHWFPYGHPLGHRGFSHSLACAALLGVLAAIACRRDAGAVPGGVVGLGLLFTAVTASHGILDALTDGGLGIPFFMPLDNTRYFFPVRSIPVSPIGVSAFLSDWGLDVLRWELLLIWPFAAAIAWPRGGPRPRAAAALLAGMGVVAWAWRLGGLAVLGSL